MYLEFKPLKRRIRLGKVKVSLILTSLPLTSGLVNVTTFIDWRIMLKSQQFLKHSQGRNYQRNQNLISPWFLALFSHTVFKGKAPWVSWEWTRCQIIALPIFRPLHVLDMIWISQCFLSGVNSQGHHWWCYLVTRGCVSTFVGGV